MSTLPLWWSRELDGKPSLVRQARSWVAELLPACAPLDDLLIFASELATNAVTHTRSGHPGGRFTVEVTWSPQAARVVVGDQGSHEVPAIAASDGDQAAFLQSGRGLLLIDTLSAAWGIAGDATARWLWADVHWRSQGGPLPTAADGDSDAARHLATLHHAYPGTMPWYSPQSGQWHAILPGARATGPLGAPSPVALARMLAAHGQDAAQRAGTTVPAHDPDQPRATRQPLPRKASSMTQHACTCGYQAEDPEDLTAHFGEMFIPANDTASDGQAHFEASGDKETATGTPSVTMTCRCGLTAPLSEFDQHLLDVFAPADRVGLDGQRHAPAADRL